MNNLAPSYLGELVGLRKANKYNLRVDSDYLYPDVPNKPHYKKSEYAFTHFPLHLGIVFHLTLEIILILTYFFKQAYSHLK